MPDLPLPQQMADNAILVEDLSDPNKLSNLAEVFPDAASGSLGNASSNSAVWCEFLVLNISNCQNNLPGCLVYSLSLDIFKSRLDTFLTNFL